MDEYLMDIEKGQTICVKKNATLRGGEKEWMTNK